MPRLVQQPFSWPVSRQAAASYRKLKAERKAISFETVEGPEISRAWEHLEEPSEDEDEQQAPAEAEEPKAES